MHLLTLLHTIDSINHACDDRYVVGKNNNIQKHTCLYSIYLHLLAVFVKDYNGSPPKSRKLVVFLGSFANQKRTPWNGLQRNSCQISDKPNNLQKSTHGSGQISIIPKPELRGFWGSSLIKPPFRVTSADVVIICPDPMQMSSVNQTRE